MCRPLAGRRRDTAATMSSRSQGRPRCAGHSLGGAVAKLCALRLLRRLPPAAAAAGRVRCCAFGAPALGNAALAALVAAQRWDRLFYSLTLPGALRAQAAEGNSKLELKHALLPRQAWSNAASSGASFHVTSPPHSPCTLFSAAPAFVQLSFS